MKYLTILTTFTFVAVCLAQQQPCYNQYDPRPLVPLFHLLVLYTYNYFSADPDNGIGNYCYCADGMSSRPLEP